MFHTIKQLEDRNVPHEITHMVWSDRMDLVALANVKGEVHLHRLTWTKAWSFSPPIEVLTVNGIAWRPDGKVLAIAYHTGCILLINIETKELLDKFVGYADVSFISWIRERPEVKPKDVFKLVEEELNLRFPDKSKSFLKDPPRVMHLKGTINFDELKDVTSFMQDQPEFNILAVGAHCGIIILRIFGCCTTFQLDLNDYVGHKCSIENIQMSEDLSKMFVTVKDPTGGIKIVLFDTSIFKTHSKELYNVAIKQIKLNEIVSYLHKTQISIVETWEGILLEIDNKLSKYASRVPEGGVIADFLDLLMFGICSTEMEEFLVHDITKKGWEKLGQAVEVSYSNIQTYLLKHIMRYSQNGTYHLSDLNGMALFKHRYGIIGLNEDLIQKSISLNGSFLIKACEMQQIINHSVINYKAFFRWVYGTILHLIVLDEPIPSDIQKMTQQDLSRITDFLKNFNEYGLKENKDDKKFTMERLRQYLMDSPLTIKPDMSGNDWTRFIEENQCLKNHPSILKHYEDTSLFDLYSEWKDSVNQIFDQTVSSIKEQIQHCHTFSCYSTGTSPFYMSVTNLTKDMELFSFVEPPNNLCLLQVLVDNNNKCMARCGKFNFSHEVTTDLYQVVDAKFYSTNILSVLLSEVSGNKNGFLMQLSIPAALEVLQEINVDSEQIVSNDLPYANGSDLLPKMFKNIEIPVSQLAVSGSRRVSIVLSENKRKIKLFEMEAEEDEDEDAEMTNSTMRESDVSMLDGSQME